MMQENLPDIEDPAVLQLLWCLLEADGDKLSELSEKSYDIVSLSPTDDTSSVPITYGTTFEHKNTMFSPSWISMTCEIEKKFVVSIFSVCFVNIIF